MWDFLSGVWFGFSNGAGFALIALTLYLHIKEKLDERKRLRDEDGLTDRLNDGLEAELFGAPEGSDGRH